MEATLLGVRVLRVIREAIWRHNDCRPRLRLPERLLILALKIEISAAHKVLFVRTLLLWLV